MDSMPWHKSYAAGVPRNVAYEKTTISAALARSARNFPRNTALNYMGNRISYAAYNGMVNRFATALTDLGIQHGDKVAVCLPNIPQAFVANMAVFRVGAVTVQVNPLYTERELEYQLADAEAKMVVTLSLLVPRMQKIKPATRLEKIVACHIHSYLPFPKKQLFPFVKKDMVRKIMPTEDVLVFEELIGKYGDEPVPEKGRWEDLAALLYTGGTTGVSKGVMLSHANISTNVQQFAAWFPEIKPGQERLVGNFPVFHSAGFTAIQNYCAWMANEIILVPRPEPKINIELIKKYKPTFLPAVPTIFVGLLADPDFRKLDLKAIKGFFSGAAPLAAETIAELQRLSGASMCEVYGLTETAPIACVTPWGGVIKPGTVGCPVPDTLVKIVDLEDPDKECLQGECGEIAIKGPQVMAGYYKKSEETAKVLKNGWFFTGDIGMLDEDGYLKIVDRKKDMVIAGGYNIYPVEIDNILFEHPKVLEACAVGVPDPYRGETVKAFIVLKKGETCTAEEITQFCKERLAAYKVPKAIEFLEELPKSAVGKVLRRKLRDLEQEKRGAA
ncbi:MAG: long-chain-fatty-acid--CoA ligase [Thermodesulfobacteriota bacterium]